MTIPMRPAVDGYGNPVKRPTWQGYTLKDLAEYARTGVPISSVPEGQTGYGLDEVGDASVSHDTSKPFDWKRLVGGALAGLAVTQPGAGVANVGRGFLSGTQWGDERDQNTRRNALTDSQLRYSESQNDLNQLEILDYPGKRAAERDQDLATMDLRRAQIAEAVARAQDIGARTPSQIAENEAQARAADALAWRRRHAPFAGGGATGGPTGPVQKQLEAVERQVDDTRADIGQVRFPARPSGVDLATDPGLLPAYQADSAEVGRRLAGLRTRADSLGPVRDSLAALNQGRTYRRPAPGTPAPLTAAPIYARPPAGGAQAAPAEKIPVEQVEYDMIVDELGADYAARHYTVSE